jgi:hypothetical protein
MEAIGRVRKVKSKIKDGVEKAVDKSKEMLENRKSDDADDDHDNFEFRKMKITNGHGASVVESDSSGHVNKISSGLRRVNLDEDLGHVENENANE